MKLTVFFLVTILFCTMSFAQQRTDSKKIVDQVLSDVFEQTIHKGKHIVRKNTGIDLRTRGYKSLERYSGKISDEKEKELDKLSDEHDRKIDQLYEKLNKKITKSRDEFKRENAKEDKREKIEEKRYKFQKKVDEVYSKFNEKVDEENRRFDEKRRDILSK